MELSDVLRAGEFLVAYDYGMGGLWGVVAASSPEAILAKYPELGISAVVPPWMTADRLLELRADRMSVEDEPPRDMLAAVVADRERD